MSIQNILRDLGKIAPQKWCVPDIERECLNGSRDVTAIHTQMVELLWTFVRSLQCYMIAH